METESDDESAAMILTREEKALVANHRAAVAKKKADSDFQRKSLEAALGFFDWSAKEGYGLTYSTFVSQFGYDNGDSKAVYEAVGRILQASKIETVS